MRKFVCLVLVFMMFFTMTGIAIPRAKAETPIYGNVYLFDSNVPSLWALFNLNWQLSPPVVYNTNCQDTKAVGLVNIGKILEIFIMIPLAKSCVIIFYKGTMYHCFLIPYRVYEHCIVFTFKFYP